MTVEANDRRRTHAGNGIATAFTGPRTFDADWISAYRTDDVTGAVTDYLTSEFAVSNVGRDSSTVTFTVAPPSGSTVTILRTVPIAQTFRFVNQGAFLPELHENAADVGIMIAQQLEEEISTLPATVTQNFQPPGTGSRLQPVSEPLTRGVNVLWFATAAQVAIDASAALQSAIAYAAVSGRKAVYFPGGYTYHFAVASASIDPGTLDLEFYGDGLSSILEFDEGSSTGAVFARKHLFLNIDNVTKGKLRFRNLNIVGTWAGGGYAERGGAPLLLDHYEEIAIVDCHFSNLSWMATVCEANGRVLVTNCVFDTIARDMVRFRSTFNVIITNNHFKRCDDDAIALHQGATYTGTAIREGIVIADNLFEDTCSTKALGGRMVSIRNNTYRRTKNGCIILATDSLEGDTNMFAIDVTGNKCYDTLERAPFSTPAAAAISVTGGSRKGGASTSNVVPGENNTSTGVFVKPWDQRNNAISTAAASLPPTFFVRVCDNVIARTLPAVGAYSTWGYGQAITASGFSNAAVSETALRVTAGIYLAGDSRAVMVSGNTISHCVSAVYVSAGAGNFMLSDSLICNNVFTDYTSYGVVLETPGGARYTSLQIRGNVFDADPYHLNANRGAAGSWTADSFPIGVWCNLTHGVRIESNRFMNLCRPVSNSGSANIYLNANTVRAFPAAPFFSTSNKGVGVIAGGGDEYRYEIFDCDPTSATYNTMLNATPTTAGAQPSSGRWVAGTFVQNTDWTTNPLVDGWRRLVTGTAHVAGTDWKKVALS